MNKQNFNALMIDELKRNSGKKLLLHSCCAPCSTTCIERLKEHLDITVFYYNPNIDTESEFILRANEQKRYCQKVSVNCIISDYDKKAFLDEVKGLENEVEGGKRCEKCFYLRLKKTALKCKELGFDYFATTLTVSPLKNATLINRIGKEIEDECGIKYLFTDFKKDNGYLRSITLSKENGLYRQNYCGCEFSKIKQERSN